MLPFKVHLLQARGNKYILLPKMTRRQMQILAQRLADNGYSVEFKSGLSARSREESILVEPSGFCRSTADPADSVLPAIPDVLASPKDRMPLERWLSMYFTLGGPRESEMVRVTTRVESYSVWDLLRSSDQCGLAPDEHLMASFLISRAHGRCRVLTDFPTEGSAVRICGRKLYFDSTIECDRASGTLRVAGLRAHENSYLPRGGVVELPGFDAPSKREWSDLAYRLGEWCFFTPE